MGFKFNPFSGTFDATGASDAAPFAGQVDAYADLPLDSTAALNSRWLVKNNSGTWPFSTYKQAGIYIRVNTVGASRDTDYQFVGTLPSVMNDNEFLIYDDADATKNLKFQLSGISTGTTRTLTVPNASGTLGWLQSVSSITVSTDHQLTAARNQRVLVNSTHIGSGAVVYLPAANNAEGDRLEVACVGLAAGTLSVRTGQYDFTVSTSMGLNEQRTFIYASGSWTLGSVESHTHAGLGPTFASSSFRLNDGTRYLGFSLSSLTPAVPRTLTVPDASGTIALTSDFASPPVIGAQTPNTAIFSNLWATSRLNLPSSGSSANDIWVSSGRVRYQSGNLITSARTLLNAEDNLSNLADTATARANLGLGGWATLSDGAALRAENLTISDGESPDYIQFTAGSGVIFSGNRASQFRGALGLGTSDNVTFGSIQNTPIGSTTRNSGAFTTLAANNGTVTASAPVLDLAQTWNNSGVTFTGLRFNVTNTQSAAASLLADFQNGGNSVFSINRGATNLSRVTIRCPAGDANDFTELTHSPGLFTILNNRNGNIMLGGNTGVEYSVTYFAARARQSLGTSSLGWNGLFLCGAAGGTNDVVLLRDDANTPAFRNTTNPQTFRLYTTYGGTGGADFERFFIRGQTGGAFQIGTEKGGTGSTRNISFTVDGTEIAQFYANNTAGTPNGFYINAGFRMGTFGRGNLFFNLAGGATIWNSSETDFTLFRFGGTTNLFPALKRSSTALQVRLADDSAFAPLECAGLTLNGNLTASTRNIVTDTTTGTRIGTGTTQLLGFWNAAPSAQPAAVADATDAASTQARLNDLLARLRTIGIIAT